MKTNSNFFKAHQSENNINILDSKLSNLLHLTSFTSSAPDGDERSNLSPPAQPLAGSPIKVIGVSLYHIEPKHPDRRKLKISTIRDDGSQQQYSASLTHYSRKRELLSNIPEQFRTWDGYREALDFISSLTDKENAYIGKLKNTTSYQAGVPKNMPIVAKTAVVHWLSDEGVHTRIWLGSNSYDVDLYGSGLNASQQKYYLGIGYWRDETVEVEEFE